MKKHLLLSAVITAGVGANVSASENIIPYLPTKVILETEVPQNNYKSLDFDSPFSLEVIAENNSVITICNTLIKGIDYKVTEGGKYRFSFDGTEIYVYKDSRFLESLKPAVLNYHDVFADTDDSILKTGIYSEKNHFLNPGFEDMDEGETETNNQYIPAVWRSTNFYEGSRSRVNTNYGNNLNGIEGRGALMHHGYTPGTGMYFYQELSTLKPESEYMVTFRTWSHSNAFGGYTAKMGTTENGTEITSYSWTQIETAYDKKDISFTFN